jgi:hypothetical protein
MATRKQRRRKAKEHRHDYVWVDDEGNEVEPPEGADHGPGAGARQKKPSGRAAQPPSWRKSIRRGAIFAPLMLVTVMLLSRNLTLGEQIGQALFIALVFVPFTYFLDRLFYRAALRRQGGTGGRPGS